MAPTVYVRIVNGRDNSGGQVAIDSAGKVKDNFFHI